MNLVRWSLCFVIASLVGCQQASSSGKGTGGSGSGGQSAGGRAGTGGSGAGGLGGTANARDAAANDHDDAVPNNSADLVPDKPTDVLRADALTSGDGVQSSRDLVPGGGDTPSDTSIVVPPPDGAQGNALACDNPGACTDFPTTPIHDPLSPKPIPSNPENSFAAPASGDGPCVTEPEDGSLYPFNWTRPRIKWSSTSATLAQITVHADIEANDLVVYTMADQWVMDAAIWQGLAAHVHESDIAVTVRSVGAGSTTVRFQIANAPASGSIVFWAADPAAIGNVDINTTSDKSSYLRGFTVGEEATGTTLKFTQIAQTSRQQSYDVRTPTCIGCHSATPDPGFVAFLDNFPWNSVIAGIGPDNVGAQLPGLTLGGLTALNKPWAGAATFAASAWTPGKRIMVTTSAQLNDSTPWSTDEKEPAKLVWYNLDAPAPSATVYDAGIATPGAQYGIIARDGDSHGAAFPTWSHDGSTIVYSSTNGGCFDGRLDRGATDLYTVPFADGKGGQATPVPGASDPNWEEYYAGYAPDDQLVAFNRVRAGGVMYANQDAELFVVPVGSASGAGTSIRLAANDPVACSNKTSPGVNNHYARWAPNAPSFNGTKYYWLIYGSYRAGLPPVNSKYDGTSHLISQLYATAVTVKDGVYKTYKSIYLWWQPTVTTNLTPVWDNLRIPPSN